MNRDSGVTVPDMVSDAAVVPPSEDTSLPLDAAPDAGEDASAPPDVGVEPIICDGRAVDPQTSASHCGRCNNVCDRDHGSCVDGACVCELGGAACGSDNSCTNVDYDSNNCGSCGNVCSAGELCFQGSCICRPGLMRCDGACVDTESNPMHCGGCGMSCNGKACVDGGCKNRNSCPLGTFPCDEPGGLACIRGRDSDLHCNPTLSDTCGDPCAGDQFCYDPGLFSGPSCVTYRPGLGCAQCPCADCEDGEACVETDDAPDVAFCVRR